MSAITLLVRTNGTLTRDALRVVRSRVQTDVSSDIQATDASDLLAEYGVVATLVLAVEASPAQRGAVTRRINSRSASREARKARGSRKTTGFVTEFARARKVNPALTQAEFAATWTAPVVEDAPVSPAPVDLDAIDWDAAFAG